jgi:hypothetical protein
VLLRVVVTDSGAAELPPVDVEGDFVIGSGADARIRLPASAAKAEQVRVRAAEIGDGKTLAIGRYRVRVAPAPAGAVAASPQRTESLARELVRGLLGANAAPTLEIVRGPHVGAKRALAAPESRLVIGRGDEAGWIIDDEDLSRAHAELRRGWDGTWVKDLGSKNGTRVDGAAAGQDAEVALRDGAAIELGRVAMRFRDPAERHLRPSPSPGPSPAPNPKPSPSPNPNPNPNPNPRRGNLAVFYVALAVMFGALAALVWIVTA